MKLTWVLLQIIVCIRCEHNHLIYNRQPCTGGPCATSTFDPKSFDQSDADTHCSSHPDQCKPDAHRVYNWNVNNAPGFHQFAENTYITRKYADNGDRETDCGDDFETRTGFVCDDRILNVDPSSDLENTRFRFACQYICWMMNHRYNNHQWVYPLFCRNSINKQYQRRN